MDWLQISIELPTADGDTAASEDLLRSLGALSVSLTNATDTPLFEPQPGAMPLWKRSWLTGLFAAETDPAEIVLGIQAGLGLPELPRYRTERLPDRDWIRAGLAGLRPLRFGRRLWTCPGNHAVNEPGAVVVHLDPGLAFGTGAHPSTALCLQRLDALDLTGLTVIDYGCGSGILAVAAAKLGARFVYAVDIDPQALLATRDNAARNAVDDRVQALAAGSPALQPADLVVANILSGTLQQLAAAFAGLVRPGGGLVLAGLLEDDAEETRQAYRPWFDLPQARFADGWLCLFGTRR